MADSRGPAFTGSNNPFRRKAASAPDVSASAAISINPVFESSSDTVDLPPQHNASDIFRQQIQAVPHTNEPPPSTTFQKPKVVKKVRVQSPPPSSPESASGAPHEYPRYGYSDVASESSSDDDDEPEDPFRSIPPPSVAAGLANSSAPASVLPISTRPPPNPFKKTLDDIEHGSNDVSQMPSASVGGKGSLDVDAFKRLLMTGHADAPGTVPSPSVSSPSTLNHPSHAADAASITDASSVSRQSIFDTTAAQETPRTSHEISEAEGEEDRLGLIQNSQTKTQPTTSTLRKKPPPPSSRHGKLIKVDLSKQDHNSNLGLDGALRPFSSPSHIVVPGSPSSTSSRRRPSTPSDVNKPLPPAPARHSIDEGSDSIFDREAAGKVPEPVDPELDADTIPSARPPTPPNASHAATKATIPADPRKPPPPPRRNTHSRTESKLSAASPGAAVPTGPIFTEEPSSMRRSSQDSTRSRSSSVRVNIHAPALPPPRRPNHVSRPSFTSSSVANLASPTPPVSSAVASSALPDGEHAPLHNSVSLVNSPDAASSGRTSSNAAATASLPVAPKTKLSPPPLPPARNASVRSAGGRPPSLRSVNTTSRIIKESHGSVSAAPPPPPPPKRSRAGSGRDRGALLDGSVAVQPATPSTDDGSGRISEDKSADDILADLNALQREVDALRGKYEKNPAAGV